MHLYRMRTPATPTPTVNEHCEDEGRTQGWEAEAATLEATLLRCNVHGG